MELDLEPFERDLILRFGCPFEAVEAAVKAAKGTVSLDSFEIEQLLGELSRSVNHDDVPDESLDAVDALCDRLEWELRYRAKG